MKIKITFKSLLVITGLLLQFNLWAQVPPVTLHVETAGTLSTLIAGTGYGWYEITDLTLTGNLNDTDMQFIREMVETKKLKNLNLSGVNSLTSIKNRAFAYCTGLTSITIPNSVTTIEYDAFYGCTGLTSVTIGNSVKTIGNEAFRSCFGLTSITIPDSVTSIGNGTFRDCSGLTSVTIGNSVIGIGVQAFYECRRLTSVTIGNNVIGIGSEAFYDCFGLTSITIPNSVTSIGSSAFDGCYGLTSITIGNSVKTIEESAFYGCTRLTSITIPKSVTTIRKEAFYGCYGLEEIHSKNFTPPSLGSDAFQNVNKKFSKLYVPKGSYMAYWDLWGFDNIIEEEGTTAISTINKDNITINSIINGISIATKEAMPIAVYNLSGQKMYQSVVNGNAEIRLDKGVYIVRAKNESKKVIVK